MLSAREFWIFFNRLKSFDKTINAVGPAANTLIDYIADRSAGVDPSKLKMGDNLPDPFVYNPG